MVYLWVFSVLLHIFQPPWNSPAVSGGVGAIFLAPNHSIPSAWWSLLINHVTMFHNLGITASMSLITICALLKPKGSHTLWLEGWKTLDLTTQKSYQDLEFQVCYAPTAYVKKFLSSPPAVAVAVSFRIWGFLVATQFDVHVWPQEPQVSFCCSSASSSSKCVSSFWPIQYTYCKSHSDLDKQVVLNMLEAPISSAPSKRQQQFACLRGNVLACCAEILMPDAFTQQIAKGPSQWFCMFNFKSCILHFTSQHCLSHTRSLSFRNLKLFFFPLTE